MTRDVDQRNFAQGGTMAARTLVLAVAMSLVGVSQAAASLIFDFSEVAGDVQLVVSGTIDLNATSGSFGLTTNVSQLIVASGGNILAGDAVQGDGYNVSSNWTPFGTGGFFSFDVSSGDRVALFSNPVLGLPIGYLSGTPLSATGTLNGQTFASLGLTPGSWVTLLENGEFTDSVVVNVGTTVPEPTTLFLLGTGLGAVAARRRLKKGA